MAWDDLDGDTDLDLVGANYDAELERYEAMEAYRSGRHYARPSGRHAADRHPVTFHRGACNLACPRGYEDVLAKREPRTIIPDPPPAAESPPRPGTPAPPRTQILGGDALKLGQLSVAARPTPARHGS